MKKKKIYDLDYYKFQFIINDQKFIKRIERLKQLFAGFGCPIPTHGLPDYKAYLSWNGHYFSVLAKLEQSKTFQNKIKKITGGSNSWGSQTQDEIEELKEKELPPIYGGFIRRLLAEYGITDDDSNYSRFYDYVIGYIFLNVTEFTNAPIAIHRKSNPKTKKMELFVQIFAHTRKEDVGDIWPIIKNYQKYLPTVKHKNKEYKNFHRDLDIYNTYKSLQNPSRKKGANLHDNKRADEETNNLIVEKYGQNMTWESIRKIVSNIEKLRKKSGL